MERDLNVVKYVGNSLHSLGPWKPNVFRRIEDSGIFRISKRGAKFSLATSAHTKGGAKPSFPIFVVCQKKFFLPKGAMAQWPPP